MKKLDISHNPQTVLLKNDFIAAGETVINIRGV